jgi:hypothetical protein
LGADEQYEGAAELKQAVETLVEEITRSFKEGQ